MKNRRALAVARNPRTAFRRALAAAAAVAVFLPAGAVGPIEKDLDKEAAAPPRIAMDPRVTHLSLDVSLEPETGVLRETATVTVEGKGLGTLSFRLAESMVVERSRASAGVIDTTRASDGIRVYVDPPIDGSRKLSFEISGIPARSGHPLVSPKLAALGGDDDWYPVFASTWAEADLSVAAPAGWTVLGPGKRDPRAPAGTWRYRAAKPVRTLAFAAAPGLALGEASAVGAEFRFAAPASSPAAADLAARLADAMAWYSGALAPYPFDGFNLALLPEGAPRAVGSGFAAIAAGTPLAGATDGADVLASQWFGQRVAGDGAWIEAFAAWEATVFARDRALPLPAEIAALRSASFDVGSRDVPIGRAPHGAPPEILRGKGSAAPDMVRLVVGDRRFFEGIRDLFAAPIGPPISIADVRSALEKRAGQRLLRPFSEWFDRSGVPELQVALRVMPAATGGFRADLTIRQARGIYGLPLEVVFRSVAEEHRETIELDGETTAPYYVLPFEPLRVEVDPLSRIFKAPGSSSSVPAAR